MLPVQGAYFFVYVVEELQLVEVLQGKAATVYGPAFLRAQSFGILQQRHQAAFRQADNLVFARGRFRSPVLGICQAVLQGGGHHIFVCQLAVAQLAEVAADAPGASFQVFGDEGMSVQFAFELVVEAFHLFQGFGFHFAQYIPVKFQRIGGAQALAQGFAALNVAFVEDVAAETFYFVRYVPTFVVADAFVDVLQQPCQHGGGGSQFLDEAVYGIAQYFGVVQFDVQVGA